MKTETDQMKRKYIDSHVEISTKDMSREDWLFYRKNGIGGSDASAVAGINPWKTPLNVYLDKTTDEIDNSTSFRMDLGNRLEGLVAELFTEETGKKTRNINGILRNDKYPFAFANIDRQVVGEKAILECKTTNSFAANEWKEGVPPHYEIQCMHYMAVTGADRCYIAALIGNQEFKIHILERDEETIQYLMQIEKEFWQEYVKGDKVPDPDGSSQYSDYLKDKYPNSNGEKINLDYLSGGQDLINKYLDLKNEMKEMEKDIKQIEQTLQEEMQENEQASLGDYKITWKTSTRTSLDSKAIKLNHPEIYAKYTNTSKYRRFTVK